MGKSNGAIIDALDAAGGVLTLQELADVLHRKRARDIRRRNLPLLEEAGIVTVDGDTVILSDNWLVSLQEQRKLGKEIEAGETARQRHKLRSRAYREWLALAPEQRKALREQRKRSRADGFIGDLRSADEPEKALPEPNLPPLALAIRQYLDRNPDDACQPPGWIGSTLWAYNLVEGKPVAAEVRAAIDNLGGESYLRSRLNRAREVA